MADGKARTFAVVPDQSAVLVEARSTVGPISFGVTGLSGNCRAVLDGADFDVSEPLEATLVMPVASLTSGNQLYDAEIRSRLHSVRYPTMTAELRTVDRTGPGRFSVTGELTIHGTTRIQTGTLAVAFDPSNWTGPEPEGLRVVASGTQIVDIRDFDIELPSMLMLQIFPDVTVRYRVAAVADAG